MMHAYSSTMPPRPSFSRSASNASFEEECSSSLGRRTEFRARTTTKEYEDVPILTDTEEVASFLLSLKHRSVTPEPHGPPSSSSSLSSSRSSIGSLEDIRRNPNQAQSSSYLERPPQAISMEKPPRPSSASMSSNRRSTKNDSSSLISSSRSGSPNMTDFPVEDLVADSELVNMNDRDLVPDALFVAMAQMKQCRLTQADRVGCYKTREVGFIGMCCKHCGGQPGFGRYYPNSVRSLAQTTTSQTILKHVATKCRFAPPEVRHAVTELQRQHTEREGLASGRPRYGSRKIFFQRVWARLHEQAASAPSAPSPEESTPIKNNSRSYNKNDEESSSDSSHSSKSAVSQQQQQSAVTPGSSLDDNASNSTPSDLDEEVSTVASTSSSSADREVHSYNNSSSNDVVTPHQQTRPQQAYSNKRKIYHRYGNGCNSTSPPMQQQQLQQPSHHKRQKVSLGEVGGMNQQQRQPGLPPPPPTQHYRHLPQHHHPQGPPPQHYHHHPQAHYHPHGDYRHQHVPQY